MLTVGESDAPYRRSVATAIARLRVLSTITISRAQPRRTNDNRQAEPTAPAPTTPTFINSISASRTVERAGSATLRRPMQFLYRDPRAPSNRQPGRLVCRDRRGALGRNHPLRPVALRLEDLGQQEQIREQRAQMD